MGGAREAKKLTPLILILSSTVWGAYSEDVPLVVSVIGNKTIALLIGTLVAYLVAATNMSRTEMETSANTAIQSAGIVLLITGAGGSFGAIIKAGGISDMIAEAADTSLRF
ncbi:hypothetical protein [Schaalia suimastitidis]|uniref:GntT/GntP/DsdX family permease n=1 Tax=Schaalia suimastitidis TaxID=121163 RepID=UPI00042999C7|nr:hypothetical protein [Schaalia suimastitidis]